MAVRTGDAPLVPARMLAEYVYCPRLMYLEWVERVWEESPETVDGRRLHTEIDRPQHLAGKGARDSDREPEADPGKPRIVRSLELADEALGLTARLDLAELTDVRAVPVEYKVGQGPRDGAWPADVAQVTVQAMLLRENGYHCDEGVVYYAAARKRVNVAITADAVQSVLTARDHMQEAAAQTGPPPPLVDSPKCVGCSLAGICLPDEITSLAVAQGGAGDPAGAPVSIVRRDRIRRLLAARPDRVPLHAMTQGSAIRKSGDRLKVTLRNETLSEVRLSDLSAVSVFGHVEITAPALAALFDAGVPVLYFSYGGWFRGMTSAALAQNAPMRLMQCKASADPERSLRAARAIVAAKIHNSRLLIRRNAAGHATLRPLQDAQRRARRAATEESLLGLEGHAARLYFQAFGSLLSPDLGFAWESRNRRPPRDPVNALLSYLYAILLKDTIAAIHAVGLDPFVGLYHHPGYGKPSLGLDLMESYRPVIADSVTLGLLNRRMLTASDFVRTSQGVTLKDGARRRVLEAYEQRMDTMFEHGLFGYQVSYRRSLEIDARLLGRYLDRELPEFLPLRIR